MKKRKIDQTKIVIKPAKMSGAKNRVSVLRLYCTVKLRLVVISRELFPIFYQNTTFIHDWPDKLNDPYGK